MSKGKAAKKEVPKKVWQPKSTTAKRKAASAAKSTTRCTPYPIVMGHSADIRTLRKPLVSVIDISQAESSLEKNHTLLVNALKKLKTISELEDNWNDNGAKQFEKSLLAQCFIILSVLEKFPPEVFPVADRSIQMEYDGDDDSYLQFRIYEDDIREFCVLSNGERITKHINSTEILGEVKKFYGRSQR